MTINDLQLLSKTWLNLTNVTEKKYVTQVTY